jgi:hypothetical protein
MSRAIWVVILAAVPGSLLCSAAPAGDVYGVKFAPPRLYFVHASLNKSGVEGGADGVWGPEYRNHAATWLCLWSAGSGLPSGKG